MSTKSKASAKAESRTAIIVALHEYVKLTTTFQLLTRQTIKETGVNLLNALINT